jgi:UDP-glucose 4-epimerase
MRIEGKRVFVTGAAGFIGGNLCRSLTLVGAEVVGSFHGNRPDTTGVSLWVKGDVADAERIRSLVSEIRPDIIFHLAGEVHGSRDRRSVMGMLKNNLLGTVNVLSAATDIGCERIIVAGSLEEPDAGTADAIPCSPYAASKWAGGAYARMFHALYGTPVAIARLFMVYGQGHQDTKKLVPYVTRSLLLGESPRISSGERLVDWIYVDDVVEGLIAMACAPNICGQTIDIGSGVLSSVRDVVNRLWRLIPSEGVPQFGALADRPMEQVRVANVTRTFILIGWKPRTDLDKGLRLTIDWHRSQMSTSSRSRIGEDHASQSREACSKVI